jgi:hypothetical protein
MMLVFCSLLLSWLLALRLVVLRLLNILLRCHLPHLRLFHLLLVVSGGLHCAHCDRNGLVEAFCYRKKKAQKAHARRSSQGTGGVGSRGSERSSDGSETHEILMLLRRIVTSTSTGAIGTMTQSSALIGSTPTSQSSTLGPPTAPPGTYS